MQSATKIFATPPIFALDLETLPVKKWRQPNAKISDYFNYGIAIGKTLQDLMKKRGNSMLGSYGRIRRSSPKSVKENSLPAPTAAIYLPIPILTLTLICRWIWVD